MPARNHPLATASDLWRAQIIWTRTDGTRTVRYEGPYPAKHTAKGRISWWRSFFEQKDPSVVVTGKPQQCKPVWNDVEET